MFLTLFLLLFVIGTVVLCIVIASAAWGFWVTRVPYVRSNWEDTKKLLARVPMASTDTFYDLGSGDGRVVFMAEQMYDVRGVGFELTFWTYFQAVLKKRRKRSGVQFLRKNFFKESWENANVIYCYLYPPLMRSIEEKFLADCKPGTILVSRDFALPTLRPSEVVNFKAPHNAFIYKRV